jgi:protein-tyrosine phosphatase
MGDALHGRRSLPQVERETEPVTLVKLPDGGRVQAHGYAGVVSRDGHETPDWALYLDEGWQNRQRTWPARFIDWPDFELPVDEADAFDAITEAHQRARAGQLVELACAGGTGRTGTALACMAVLAGVGVDGVVLWVRAAYHPWAVEVDEQEAMITRFARYAAR